MQKRHLNRRTYFREQSVTTKKYVIPFIETCVEIGTKASVLEIGCGEGGNLAPFLQMGCKRVVGIDISKWKINNCIEFYKNFPESENLELICNDIFNIGDIGKFDIIIARDVLEHIHGHAEFMQKMKNLLTPKGKFFLGFPPWQNPFGGHQQIIKNRFLSGIPYIHLLPSPVYKSVLKAFNQNESAINDLLEIKETRITIEQFEKILNNEGYVIDKKAFYFINPNYEIKFGLKPRKAWSVIASTPLLRNFLITTNYYLVSANTKNSPHNQNNVLLESNHEVSNYHKSKVPVLIMEV